MIMAECANPCRSLLQLALALLLVSIPCVLLRTAAELDADKAAEISREIREMFRESGMNWVSPKMLQVGGSRYACMAGAAVHQALGQP